MKNYNYAEEIIKDNFSKIYTSPDDDIVNEQEQNKPLNLVDEPGGNYGKEKSFEEGVKNDNVNIVEDPGEAIDTDKVSE